MLYNTDNEYKLKKEDIALLNEAELLDIEDKRATLNKYYMRQNSLKPSLTPVYDKDLEVNEIDDLLNKYWYYDPKYDAQCHAIILNKAIPVSLFMLFRNEAKKFNFNDIIVSTPTERDEYYRWKQ